MPPSFLSVELSWLFCPKLGTQISMVCVALICQTERHKLNWSLTSDQQQIAMESTWTGEVDHGLKSEMKLEYALQVYLIPMCIEAENRGPLVALLALKPPCHACSHL